MLQSVREYIQELPDIRFSDFYQDYIIESESKVRSHRINLDSHKFNSVEDIGSIIIGLNLMTEELKQL